MGAGTWEVLVGDCRASMAGMPAGHFHCCVTSPPYWGLRDYGTGRWEGGDPSCGHLGAPQRTKANVNANTGTGVDRKNAYGREPMFGTCTNCGAVRIDEQLGSEPTPEEFIANMVSVFREVRRVLRDDGTVWLNLGDTYSSGSARTRSPSGDEGYGKHDFKGNPNVSIRASHDTPAGSLLMVPHRVALALQADGWIVRQDIVWHKPAVMPESVRSRCTKSHEYVFLLAKSMKYYFDAAAIRENPEAVYSRKATKSDRSKLRGDDGKVAYMTDSDTRGFGREIVTVGRNKRSVWKVASQGYRGAHFATFPAALIRPMILAGTSEKGCCPACGAPWVRETRMTKLRRERPNDLTKRTGEAGTGNHCGNTVAGVSVETLGWRPSCTCPPPAVPVPCRVLDPFGGSGTTAGVAVSLGRSAVVCELNPDYAALMPDRVADLCRPRREKRAKVGAPTPAVPSLFDGVDTDAD